MSNPYQTPTHQPSSVSAAGPPKSPAAHLITLYSSAMFCWFTFAHAIHLSWQDMFGGPEPAETIHYFIATAVFGIAAELAGILLFMWRQDAGIGVLIFSAIVMTAAALPLFFAVAAMLDS